jgi:hypothetical protein
MQIKRWKPKTKVLYKKKRDCKYPYSYPIDRRVEALETKI